MTYYHSMCIDNMCIPPIEFLRVILYLPRASNSSGAEMQFVFRWWQTSDFLSNFYVNSRVHQIFIEKKSAGANSVITSSGADLNVQSTIEKVC